MMNKKVEWIKAVAESEFYVSHSDGFKYSQLDEDTGYYEMIMPESILYKIVFNNAKFLQFEKLLSKNNRELNNYFRSQGFSEEQIKDYWNREGVKHE
jgi:hypothetical protein